MKKLIIAMAAIFGLSGALMAQGAKTPQRFAFVNSQKIIDTLPEKDSAKLKLQSDVAYFEQQLQDLEKEIGAKQSEYEMEKVKKDASSLRLEIMQQNIQKMYQNYQGMQQMMQQELQMLEAKYSAPLMDLVKSGVTAVCKAKGYTHCMDNSSGAVLYMVNTGDDITDAVIAYLLAQKPVATPATPK